MRTANAGLIASNAGTDVVKPACLCLPGHLTVTDKRACHAAHVSSALGNDLLGNLGLIYTPGGDDGQVRGLSDRVPDGL